MADLNDRINRLEQEVASLPSGYISNKRINGIIRQYYQWTEDGKKKSRYLDNESAARFIPLIEKRRKLQAEIKRLKTEMLAGEDLPAAEPTPIGTILFEEKLESFVNPIKDLKRRDCYVKLEDYITNDYIGKVFILYGLRRTGKTTLIKQAILSITENSLDKTAFLQLEPGDTLGDVNSTLRILMERGFKYVFIDEVTLAEDFIEGAALLSDIYASSGMKIVLSGTDSLGFIFSENEELYDRCIMLHTTFISYKEFESVLGITGIDEYIRFGGTMSMSGRNYNDNSTFRTEKSTSEYIDSAIAKNIQHSLKYYQNGGHFRNLIDLYDKNELTSAINRVVEDINHRFTIEVLTDDFKSHDLGISKRNLRKDRSNPTSILDKINCDSLTDRLKTALDILNADERLVNISEAHRIEIKEYLDYLDLTEDILTETIPVQNHKTYRTAITQPGLRYAQAKALVNQLLKDAVFQSISATERKEITERILNEIMGRMMEDIILLETHKAKSDMDVFRLQFAVGEFDMVIADREAVTCEIYEIKHSNQVHPEQYKNLNDTDKTEATKFRFGEIISRNVIYRGDTTDVGGIHYINVEEYLKSL